MTRTRRTLLTQGLAGCALAGLGPWEVASAQEKWPARAIRIVNMGPPGSPPDTYARLYAERLTKALGVPVVIENKPGAGANLASEAVAKAAPDGYTLLYTVSSAFVINPFVYRKLSFDVHKDLRAVAPVIAQGGFLVVNNALPVSSLAELVAYARSHPGKLAYASYGIGGFLHLLMELLTREARVEMLHVPYRAGAMNDVVSGQVQLMVEPAASAIPMIRAGRVRAVAYMGPKRHVQFPQLPAVAETYPEVATVGWHGLWAPGGTPDSIVRRLNAELSRITRMPDVEKQIVELGSDPMLGTPESMEAMVSAESRLWSELIRSKNITVD